MAETFQSKVCRHFGLPTERYGDWVLRATLYPHAGWLRLCGAHTWLAPDRNFIEEAGWKTHWRGLHRAARDYQHDPANRTLGRRFLRLRVSVSRLRDLYAEVSGEPMMVEPDVAAALIGEFGVTNR